MSGLNDSEMYGLFEAGLIDSKYMDFFGRFNCFINVWTICGGLN